MEWYLWLFVSESIVIVTGNVAVLVVFTRTPALRKRKHYLLVSLAVADLLVGVISVPMYVTILASYNEWIRIIYTIQDPLLGTASLFGLAAVAIERAYAVYFPFKYRTLWKGVYMIGIAVLWIMATILASCFLTFDGLFAFFAPNVAVALSLVIIIISYFLIWIKIKCMTSVQGHAFHERDKRLTVTLFIVTIVSLLAWIPFQAMVICLMHCHHHGIAYQYFLITKFLHYGNSLVNPIIYALRMPQFKRAVLNGLRCCQQDQLAVQVPDERPEHIRPNVIPLTTNYDNMAFRTEARDETSMNTSATQVHGKDNEENTFL